MPPFPRVDVERQGRLSPYRVDELTTFTVQNAGDGVGFRGELGKYSLLLFCDTVTQSLVPAEHTVCGNEMFTQKQGHCFFQNNSILSVVLNMLLEGRGESFCLCRRVLIPECILLLFGIEHQCCCGEDASGNCHGLLTLHGGCMSTCTLVPPGSHGTCLGTVSVRHSFLCV